jgi:hypothetical protein
MTRTVSSAFLTALADPEIEVFYAVNLDFDSGSLLFWTGYGNKVIGGETYTGTGNLLTIDGLEESTDLSARGTTLTLNGLDSTIINYALSEDYQGRSVNIYLGIGSETVEIFSGFMDQMQITDSGETSTIKLTVESKLIVLERPVARRYTEQSHQAVRNSKSLSGDDSFFRWMTRLQDKQITWGRSTEDGNS